MGKYKSKQRINESSSQTAKVSGDMSGVGSESRLVDSRPEALQMRKIQEVANNSPRVMQMKALQKSGNDSQQRLLQKKKGKRTGLPDDLKEGMESISGISLDDVNVIHNSSEPTHLQAHAFAQGTDIHLGPGQEKHLPHEAWHVVQQKQGRVKPTKQMKGKVNINDDSALEREADKMGAKALSRDLTQRKSISQGTKANSSPIIQRASKEFTRITGGTEIKNTVTWDDGGSLSTLKVDGESPLTAFLIGDTKSLFDKAKIARVQQNPAKNMIMVYPTDTKSGIWKLDMSRGGLSWKFVGEADSSGSLWWKEYYAKG